MHYAVVHAVSRLQMLPSERESSLQWKYCSQRCPVVLYRTMFPFLCFISLQVEDLLKVNYCCFLFNV